MLRAFGRVPKLARDPSFIALKSLVGGVSAAGSYAKYENLARKEVLVIRALALKDRATTTYPALHFLVGVPNEIAWHILSFWNVNVPWE